MENIIRAFFSDLLCRLQRSKRSFYALISLLSLFILAYNSASIFCTHVPISPNTSPEPASFLPENVKKPTLSEMGLVDLKAHISVKGINIDHSKRRRSQEIAEEVKSFEVRVNEFFNGNLNSINSSDSWCEFRFFMTWISSIDSFGEREMFAISSLFKTHPNGCLIIASNSLDSRDGIEILKPFLSKGFRVTSISPNFSYLFKGTPAESWYNQLMLGNVNTGEVALGQNLSNLLRLGLLYGFGGVYLDTDVILLKNLGGLKNVIGAQTLDLDTGNWSRLNNAVMIFDKGHPLLYKFIQEFALTFDGNKWGHNGPYLVSRVVHRVSSRVGYNFTVLPPIAFYPVDWSRIRSVFEGPKSLSHSKWILAKLRQIHSRSYAVHLWNKQSRGFKVEKGSIIQHLMFSCGLE